MWEFLSPYKLDADIITKSIGGNTRFFTGKEFSLENYQIAIVGIEDFRGNELNKGCEDGSNAIRQQFYKLYPITQEVSICDLGNIKAGESLNDTRFAFQRVIENLIKNQVLPIVLGGDGSFVYDQHLAYKNFDNPINIVDVRESISLLEAENEKSIDEISVQNSLIKAFSSQPNIIFNYSLLGYQSFFMNKEDISLLSKMHFEAYRLGEITEDLREIEPIVRDADMLSLNVSALRASDAPGYFNSSPNGFFAHETCRLARYAGLSDRLSSFGIYDYNPLNDRDSLTAKTLAQVIWYFLEGISQRKGDYPIVEESNFENYTVTFQDAEEDLIFLKSKKSGRWWIKIPEAHLKYKKYKIFPCSYRDYKTALQNEIPERWIRAYNKMV